jgi:GEVED domain/Secretion system C-terminal sorting domain
MKNFYSKKSFALSLFFLGFLFSNNANSQVEYHYLTGFGSALFDINDLGNATKRGGVYNFALETTIPIDPEAASLTGINNNGDLIGTMPFDVNGTIIEQPAYKRNGIWYPLGYFQGVTDQASVSTAQISENGNFITGQMSIDCCSQQAFLYHTTTSVLEKIANPLNLYSCGYAINNSGIIGGWYDQQPSGGTLRIPAYMTSGSVVTAVPGSLPLSGVNAVNAINNSNLMAGDKDGHPFLYDLTTSTFTQFEIPFGYDSATFTSVSENGIAVGYCQKFDFFINREAIIYHPNLGAQPVLLSVILNSLGISTFGTIDGKLGTAIAISPDGNFICGWENAFSFFASGWAVNLNGLLFTSCFTQCPQNITEVSLTGPKVINYSLPSIACATNPNATLVLASGLVSGSEFPIGTTNIVYNLVDSPINGTIISTCSFDVILNDTYCIPSMPFVEPITVVSIADINNNSDVNSVLEYEDFTSITGNVTQGEMYTTIFEGFTGGDYTDYFTAFIDWNQDGDFSDTSERYELGSITNSSGIDGIQATATLLVPIDALLGTTTLRIMKTYDSYNLSYCDGGNTVFGQAEDYKLLVGPNLTSKSTENSKLTYYPNPIKNELHILNNSEIDSIEIYNLLGQKIIVKNLNSKSAIINLYDIKSGTYLAKVSSKKAIKTFKIVKE